ncbi:MAG: Ig-like domain-containing protein, partial [Planctomycetota bacterium]
QIQQKEEKLNEIQLKLINETAAKARAQENLKLEREQHRKAEAKAKEEIEQAKAQAQEKARSYAAELSHVEEKFAKAKESRAIGKKITPAKEEGLKDEDKEQQSPEAHPAQTKRAFTQICRNLIHPKSRKMKVALFSVLATLSAIAITFGVSVINSPPVAKSGIATTQEDEPVAITLMANHSGREQLTYNIVKGPSYGTLSGKPPEMTYTPASNYHGPDSFTETRQKYLLKYWP